MAGEGGEEMRILGFNRKWDKLGQDTFTTLRFARKDRDWEAGELVQIVVKPRRKGGGQKLGVAEIVAKDPRRIPRHGKCGFEAPLITNEEANADGFPDYYKVIHSNAPACHVRGYSSMWEFLCQAYGSRRLREEPMHKLTLAWRERCICQ